MQQQEARPLQAYLGVQGFARVAPWGLPWGTGLCTRCTMGQRTRPPQACHLSQPVGRAGEAAESACGAGARGHLARMGDVMRLGGCDEGGQQ